MARPDQKVLRRDGAVLDDTFRTLDDAEPVPAEGAILVSQARFFAERAALLERAHPLGVVFTSATDASADPDVQRLALVAWNFTKFADGRPYSHARNLRFRLGFSGEIRATGDVLRDQIHYLARCGFDAFEVRADRDPADAGLALGDFTVNYQPWLPQPVVAVRED